MHSVVKDKSKRINYTVKTYHQDYTAIYLPLFFNFFSINQTHIWIEEKFSDIPAT